MTLTQIQDKQIAQELAANAKHGYGSPTTLKVVSGARTRARGAIMALGFTYGQASMAVREAADMVYLKLRANRYQVFWSGSNFPVADFDTMAQVNAYLARQTLPGKQFTVVKIAPGQKLA